MASEALQIIDATPADFPEVTDHLMVRASMMDGRPTKPLTRIDFVDTGAGTLRVGRRQGGGGWRSFPVLLPWRRLRVVQLDAYLFYAERIRASSRLRS